MKWREVAEGEEVGERGGVAAAPPVRVPGGQLGDDPRRGGPDVVDVQLGLRQARR